MKVSLIIGAASAIAGVALFACDERLQNAPDTTSPAETTALAADEGSGQCPRMGNGGHEDWWRGFALAGIDMMFADWDRDHDGKATIAEVVAFAEAKFADADTSKDGFIDAGEFKRMMDAHEARFLSLLNDAQRKHINDMKAAWENMPRGPMGPTGPMGGPEMPNWPAPSDGEQSPTGEPPNHPKNSGSPMGPWSPMGPMDKDRDSRISQSEFVDGHVAIFKMNDTSGTGSVTLEDLRSRLDIWHGPQRHGPRGRHHMAGGPPGPGHLGHEGTPGSQDTPDWAAERFAEADTNGDGKLSKDEFEASRRHRPRSGKGLFEKADTNGDGFVDIDEMKSFGHHRRHHH